VRHIARAINSIPVHAPWAWRLVRRFVRRFFDAAAPQWDQRIQPESPQRLAVLAAGLDQLRSPPARVLDIGTGTGAGAFLVARRYPAAEVVGIDIAPAMIELAREKAVARGLQTQFLVADIESFAPGARFDLVTMVNMPPFFKEVARLLRPGGQVLCVATLGASTPFYTRPRTQARGFERRGLRTVTSGTVGAGSYYLAELPDS
jgi:ubiquinone/menaquinone biosynthesis C-methylase UbiE